MCFDPRRSEADRLVDAWQGRMGARDREQDRINEAGAEWAAQPPRGGWVWECYNCNERVDGPTCVRCGMEGSYVPPRKAPPKDGRPVPLVLCPDAPGDPPRGGASVLARYRTPNDQFAGSIGAWLAERRRARASWDALLAEARDDYRAREARLATWRRRVHAASWWACVLALWAILLGLLWATLPPALLGGPPLPLPSLAPGRPQAPGGLGR